MIRRFVSAMVAGVVLAIPSSSAVAQGSTFNDIKLFFTTPTGTVGSHDVVQVFVTVMNTGVNPFIFDGTNPPDFGLDPALIPADGTPNGGGPQTPFASYTFAQTSAFAVCNGSFMTGGCGGTFYKFDFNTGPTSWLFRSSFTLNPGEAQDFFFATFTPVGGTAPAGNYTFFDAAMTIIISGLDANGDPLTAELNVGQTCANSDPACQFSRDVIAGAATAPEPGTIALLGTGLGFIALVRRRRNRTAA